MTATTLALVYAGLAALPLLMHLALAAGAPLGRYTVGGRFPGRLPPKWRGLALVQALLLAAMAAIVLRRADAVDFAGPGWPFWLVVGLTGTTCLANLATPSRPERIVWGPVTGLMFAAVIGVAIGT